MDFLSEQALLYSSKKYEPIYMHLNSVYEMKYQDIFLLCASLGFKKNNKIQFNEKGRELRTNYFNSKQKAAVYTIILGDQDIGKNIEAFEDAKFRLNARKTLEQYAEGGMDILVNDVFTFRWDGNKLDENYTEYDLDITTYILTDDEKVPF